MTKIQRAISRFCAKLRPAQGETPFAGEYEALCFAMYTIFMNSAYKGCIAYDVHIKDVRQINISSCKLSFWNTAKLYIDIYSDRNRHCYSIHFCEYKAVLQTKYQYRIGMKRDNDLHMLYDSLVTLEWL